MLYELLTDLKPFRGATLDEITTAVLNHEPPLANVVAPAVPAALAAITAKALAKDPEQRYRSARAFSRDLRHWLDENTSTTDSDAPVAAVRARKPLLLAIAALAAVSIGAITWSVLAPKRAPAVALDSAALAGLAPAGLESHDAATTATPAPATRPGDVPTAAPFGVAAAAAVAADRPAALAKPAPGVAAKAPKESARERRAREAEERNARSAAPAPKAVAPATGTLRIAVSPWGQVEVDGRPVGSSPPLTELHLPAGRHQIVVRNTDLPAYSTVVNVTADQPAVVKHKF